jgi:Flp pilus assembly protein TadD/HEAT repeat protein/predicted Ser/Thr protein kinase
MGLCPECLIKAGFPTGTGTDTGAAAKSPFVPPTTEEIAKLFPQLEILELIGKGGMGAVYKARQKQLNRFVALKILPPGIGGDPAFAERFTREARALAQLNHPNIVTLYEFGESSGQFYFLMEFVDGVNLRQLLNTSRVAPREALAIVPQICDALQFAHDQGIVHRDIKPENILLDRRGRVKVADFGLAKLMGTGDEPAADGNAAGSTSLTDAGKIMGTPNYMSPEQKENPGEVDHRADIYALGVVFYQMLTGELPGQRIESPSKKVHIDVRLDEIVLRALEKKPELRYQQASVLKTELETIAADPAKVESETQKLEVKPRFSRNAIVGAICLLLSAFAMPLFVKLTRQMPGDLERLDHLWVVARWSVALVLVATPLFLGSLLGWVAIAQIRRSEEKLCGLGLAVFDALFFPLLALDTLVWFLIGFIVLVIRQLHYFPASELLAFSALGTLALSAFLDILIFFIVWHALNKTGNTSKQKPDQLHRWIIIAISSTLAISLVSVLAAIAFPEFIESRGLPSSSLGTNNFFIGQSFFPKDDSITITKIERTGLFLKINGRYDLKSEDMATLGIYITSSNYTANTKGALQEIKIKKGSGDFELVYPHPIPGLPHITMYSRYGQPFAALYFGTREEADEESKMEWHYDPSTLGPVTEQVIKVNEVGYSDTLDLDTGKIVATPAMQSPFDWLAVKLPPGIMFIPATDAHPLMIAGTTASIVEMQAGEEFWDGRMAFAEARGMASEKIEDGNTSSTSGFGPFPQNFMFKTRGGKTGVLQITGVSENPHAVKVRYKFVINDGADQILPQKSAQELGQEGWQLWQNHKLNDAAWKFAQAVKLDPNDANAWNGLGWATFNSGKMDQAQHAFEKAISLDPNQPGALNGLGQIYLAQHKFGEAEGYLLKAAPNAPAAWFGLARLYLLEGKFDQAKVYAQKVVNSGQGDEIATKMLAAAKEKKLNEDLRQMIEPAALKSAAVSQGAANRTDWLKIRPLNEWITDAEGSDARLQPMARQALADLGTNILPPIFLFLDDPTNQSNEAGDRRFNMVQAVAFIGPDARAGLPHFAAMLKSGRQATAYSGAVGLAYSSAAVPEALSILTNALTDPAPGTRDAGIYGIQLCLSSQSNEAAQAALPLLLKNVGDPLDYIRSDTAVALMAFTQRQCQMSHPVPDFVIPALIKLLSDKYHYSRYYALAALNNSCLAEKIKPWRPTIEKMLNDPDNSVKSAASQLLSTLDANGLSEAEKLLAAQPPVVVETFPVSGAQDVPSGETEIRARFSKEMADHSWSWSTAWENSDPEFIGKPHYVADHKTCVMKVKLEPDHTYAFWLNSDNFHNFKDAEGRAAVPYLLIFQTKPK